LILEKKKREMIERAANSLQQPQGRHDYTPHSSETDVLAQQANNKQSTPCCPRCGKQYQIVCFSPECCGGQEL
jgi:hypothetical protein